MPRVVEATEPDIVEEIGIIAQLRSVIVVLEDHLAPPEYQQVYRVGDWRRWTADLRTWRPLRLGILNPFARSQDARFVSQVKTARGHLEKRTLERGQ